MGVGRSDRVRWLSKWTLPWGPGHFELSLLVSEVSESGSVTPQLEKGKALGTVGVHGIYTPSFLVIAPCGGDLAMSGV